MFLIQGVFNGFHDSSHTQSMYPSYDFTDIPNLKKVFFTTSFFTTTDYVYSIDG